MTCVPQLAAAHVLGQHGSVALQLLDNPAVHIDVISTAANASTEIHFHNVHA